MPLLEETTLPNNQNPSVNPSSSTNPKPNSLITTISSLLPLAPLLFEQFTGQKVPAIGGTMAEMKLAITQIQTNLQTVVNNQQQIYQQIDQLKTTASNQLTNLTHQFQNLRLTHTKEQKQIDFNRPSENPENN
jgi:phenylalanyl-tRNA synthetase alpha subunit